MTFLADKQEIELPGEYLCARLRGRSSRLYRDWQALLVAAAPCELLKGSPVSPFVETDPHAGPWDFLQSEHRWVYSRLNRSLENSLRPYFHYHELKTIILCLRHRAAGHTLENLREHLAMSLLHPAVKQLLADKDAAFPDILSGIYAGLTDDDPDSGTVYTSCNGLTGPGYEVQLRHCFFKHLGRRLMPAALQLFFRLTNDKYNIMSLAKSLHWQTIKPLPASGDGSAEPGNDPVSNARRKLALLCRRVLGPGRTIPGSLTALENALDTSLHRQLRRRCFPASETDAILFYLWDICRYAKKMGIVLSAGIVGRETAARELG